ncbi:MAG: phosphohydrolase [Pyrobaculum sp.]
MIVLGDVHIGSRYSKIGQLRKCLESIYAEKVAIVGDVFDDEYRPVGREEAARLIKKAMKILQIRPRQLYISFSSSSHDPQLSVPLVEKIDGVEVTAYNGHIHIDRVVITHGDSVVKNGVLAYLIEFASRGRLGRALRKRLMVSDDMWLVYGHSHVPYVDLERKILNPGGWKIYGFRKFMGNVYELPSAKPLCQPYL